MNDESVDTPVRSTEDNGLPMWLRFYIVILLVISIIVIAAGIAGQAPWLWVAGLSSLLSLPWLLGFTDLVHSARVIAGRNQTSGQA